MTKRKNYNAVLQVTEVGRTDADTDLPQPAGPQQHTSKPPPRKKKPKTIKIETEVEEVIVVVDNNSNNKDVGDSTASTTGKDGPIVKIRKKKKQLRRVDFDAEDDDTLLGTSIHDTNPNITNSNKSTIPKAKNSTTKISTNIFEDVRPTTIRLTENGGYLHTKQSRMKISQANQGKSPWNKGKERTLTAKAKISAGVRARNDELLQQKLKRLNITEEVWYQKKRQIKSLRERVRKAKVAAKNYIEEQKQIKEQSMREDDNDEVENQPFSTSSDPEENVYCFSATDVPVSGFHNDNDVITTSKVDTDDNVRIVEEPPEIVSQAEETVPAPESILVPQPEPPVHCNDPRTSDVFRNIPMFQRDIEWTPHAFDHGDRYDTVCPNNGPGGLVCCQDCLERYTKYMTSTVQDIQRHATIKIGREVEELYNHVRDTKQQLVQTMKVTRRKPIPIRQHSLLSTTSTTTPAAGAAAALTTTTNNKKQTKTKQQKSKDTLQAIDTSKKSKEKRAITSHGKNPPVKTTATAPDTTINIIDAKPDPDPGNVPLCEELLQAPASEFNESIVPNEAFITVPQNLLDYDEMQEVYEI